MQIQETAPQSPGFLAEPSLAMLDLLPLLRGPATVEGQDRTGGETALVAREKQDAGGNLLRRAEPAHQLALLQRVADRCRIGTLGLDLG
jgi:hypothetical protein